MEVEVRIEPERTDVRVVIHAPARTEEVERLLAVLSEREKGLLGFRGTEAVMLAPETILRFYGEDKEVRAQTAAGVFEHVQRRGKTASRGGFARLRAQRRAVPQR